MKVFDADKTRMIGLPYGEKNYDHMLSRFHLIPERYGRTDGRIDGQTDGQTDLLYQYRASVCWRAIKKQSSPPNTHVKANSATVPAALPSCEWK